MIDAYAHIVPPRFTARVEQLLADHGVPDTMKLFDPWLHDDPVLTDLDARWRLLEPYPDYRQVLVLGVFPVDELGPPEAFWVLRVEDFRGVVTIDSNGGSLHKDVLEESKAAAAKYFT